MDLFKKIFLICVIMKKIIIYKFDDLCVKIVCKWIFGLYVFFKSCYVCFKFNCDDFLNFKVVLVYYGVNFNSNFMIC